MTLVHPTLEQACLCWEENQGELQGLLPLARPSKGSRLVICLGIEGDAALRWVRFDGCLHA